MVDPEEHLRVTHTAYTEPASPAPVSSAATSDVLLARVNDLEKVLRLVQGRDRQSYHFRDLCYFLEATLLVNFHIPEFKKIQW